MIKNCILLFFSCWSFFLSAQDKDVFGAWECNGRRTKETKEIFVSNMLIEKNKESLHIRSIDTSIVFSNLVLKDSSTLSFTAVRHDSSGAMLTSDLVLEVYKEGKAIIRVSGQEKGIKASSEQYWTCGNHNGKHIAFNEPEMLKFQGLPTECKYWLVHKK